MLAMLPALWPALALAAGEPAPTGFADPVFRHVTPEQGLPNGVVTSLAQDAQGFLWVGSLDGLARWDGYRAKVFRLADERAGEARSGGAGFNAIGALHVDARGGLWVGTMFGGLLRYDAAAGTFQPWPPAGQAALSDRTVHQLADDGEQGLWVATGGGLDHVDPASGRVEHASAPGEWAEAAGTSVRAVLRDRAGRLWLATAKGLFLRATPQAPLQRMALGPQGSAPVALAQDAAGRLWASTGREGVFVLAPPAQAEADDVRWAAARVPLPALDGTWVKDMAEAKPGEMWLALQSGGVLAVDVARGTSRRIQHVPDNAASLIDNAVGVLLRDRAGLVWVGTTLGLSRHDPQREAVLQRFGSGPDEVRLEAPRMSTEVSWIQPLPGISGGGYWLGTHKAGVERVDAQGRHAGMLLLDPSRPAGRPQDMVLGMAVAGREVFVATNRGLFRAGLDGKRAERVHLDGRDAQAHTWAVLADGDTLWIGGRHDGLWRLDVKTGRGEAMRLQAPGLAGQEVTMLAGSRREGLWVGTRKGLSRVDVNTGTVTRVLATPDGGAAGGFVTAMVTDAQGRRWVGSYGGGIDILPAEGSSGAPAHVGVAQGLPAATVNALVLDERGDVWVSMDGSLARIDARTLAVQPLGRSDGVLLPTYWTGSAARGPEGEVMFGGAGGVTVVRPERFKPSSYLPQVLVTDVQVGGQPALAGAQGFTVPADGNSLAVEFSSSAFGVPERNRFAYKLEGTDADWREADPARRVAAYANLAPGEHVLRLRTAQGDGPWSAQEAALPLSVQAAWHQRWWGRGLQGLALVLAFMAAVALRTRWLGERQRELEAKVRERTAELEAAHQALEEKSRLLEQSSVTDPLTGLHNRRYVTEHIERDLAAGRRRAKDARAAGAELMDTDWAFLLVDVDRFKQVNDGHGHAAGDAVLVELGVRLRTVLRESDDLVRWGGEEFLAIARETDRLRVEELAERVREAVASQPFTLPDGQLLAVTCSIGFACMALAAEGAEPARWPQVVGLADRGLYAAKRAGRDAWVGVHTHPGAGAAAMATGDGNWVSSNRPLEAVVAAYAGAPAAEAAPAR